MPNPEDKTNANGVAPNPLQRLASLKAPRDLLLGGAKPNKKVFTPNLNVTRNKNKGASTTNNRDLKKDEKNKRSQKNDRNRNSRNSQNIIKSSGVFSEGMGSAERISSRVSYGRDVNTEPKMQKPTIRVKDVVKIDKELEEEKIKAILSEDGKEVEEAEDFKQVLEADAPVRLPMDELGLTSSNKPSLKIKEEVVVKQEPSEDGEMFTAQGEKPRPDVKDMFEDVSVANLLKSDKPTLLLLQLSDTLPGRGGSRDDDHKKPLSTPSSSSETTEEPKPPVDTRCHLSDLEEGRIGNLRIHRSGRITLALGSTIFEVSSGTKASFYQEVVSVGVDEASRSASVTSLGQLQHKLNITPDWETMFDEMSI
ncbi:unnamed protein product [Leptosia nina]|uniref:DNA-directed RNA polymerase III subunit RPC4 n=1 Tax=Leptosia nina TaxID=320188 RepID=A0AAV1J9X9_9NEOP